MLKILFFKLCICYFEYQLFLTLTEKENLRKKYIEHDHAALFIAS